MAVCKRASTGSEAIWLLTGEREVEPAIKKDSVMRLIAALFVLCCVGFGGSFVGRYAFKDSTLAMLGVGTLLVLCSRPKVRESIPSRPAEYTRAVLEGNLRRFWPAPVNSPVAPLPAARPGNSNTLHSSVHPAPDATPKDAACKLQKCRSRRALTASRACVSAIPYCFWGE